MRVRPKGALADEPIDGEGLDAAGFAVGGLSHGDDEDLPSVGRVRRCVVPGMECASRGQVTVVGLIFERGREIGRGE